MKNTILYVEDDPQIIDSAEGFLEIAFPTHRILAYEQVPEALEEIAENVDKLAIVCTDGSISGHSGWELARELKELGYPGPILYTGLSEVPSEARGLFNDNVEKSGRGLIDKVNKYLRK